MKVSLFATCLTDLFYPQVAVAIVRVLRRLGHEVDFPTEQTCCGQPAFNAGHEDEARAIAGRMIDVFERCPVVVSPSGSCVAMVREHFAQLFENDPAMKARAEALASRTFEFVEFLEKKLAVDWTPWSLRYDAVVTYHYSCHLRAIAMTDEVPVLLRKIEGIEYRQLEKMDECCGFGGVFSVKYGDIAGAMCREKLRNVLETGADILIVNDGGCTMNIAGGAHRQGNVITIKHIAEILDEAMQNGA
jgi:L-lactate dehydrogenase complex protein LldE